jgi:hypothetical protein
VANDYQGVERMPSVASPPIRHCGACTRELEPNNWTARCFPCALRVYEDITGGKGELEPGDHFIGAHGRGFAESEAADGSLTVTLLPGEIAVWLPASYCFGWVGYAWEVYLAGAFPWLVRIDGPRAMTYEVARLPGALSRERHTFPAGAATRVIREQLRAVRALCGLLTANRGGRPRDDSDIEDAIRAIDREGKEPTSGLVAAILYPHANDPYDSLYKRLDGRDGFPFSRVFADVKRRALA